MTTIIYPGTFDPITLGHVDLVERAASLFDRVVLAIADSKKKQPLFDLEQRIALCQASLAHLNNIEICGFNGLLVDFARNKNSSTVLRGVRTTQDFEYELQLTNMNRSMAAGFETVFLTPPPHLGFISSSLVREIAGMGGKIDAYVSPAVKRALDERFL